MKEYDEDGAVAHIRSKVPAAQAYSDDDILSIIDLVWDYYELNGLLEIDADDDGDDMPEVSDIAAYAMRMLHKDKNNAIQDRDVPCLVSAELDYERWLEEED